MQTLLKLKIKILENYKYQSDFSQATGIRESRLSKIIQRREQPTEKEVQVICKKLRVEPKELFSQN